MFQRYGQKLYRSAVNTVDSPMHEIFLRAFFKFYSVVFTLTIRVIFIHTVKRAYSFFSIEILRGSVWNMIMT
jgi:hypothetical protein